MDARVCCRQGRIQSSFSPPSRRQQQAHQQQQQHHQQQPQHQQSPTSYPGAIGSPDYHAHYSNHRLHGQPAGQHPMQRGAVQNMMGHLAHPSLQGHSQGMMGAGLGHQHMPHMAPHEGLPRAMMPHGLVPMQPGMPYMGYYPAQYFRAQTPGKLAPMVHVCTPNWHIHLPW